MRPHRFGTLIPLACLALATSPAQAEIIAHWKLNDGSGTTAVDAAGANNTGTLNNGPTWVTGTIGGGLDFNGTNQRVTAPVTGIPTPASHVEGRSLAPLLRQPDLDWPYPAFSQLPKQERLPGCARITPEMLGRSVHQDRWHYVSPGTVGPRLFSTSRATLATMRKSLKGSGTNGESFNEKS